MISPLGWFGIQKFDLLAPIYDWIMQYLEKNTLSKCRTRFVPMVEGKVLDLAVGTGPNIEYYPMDRIESITMIDLSSGMLNKAREKVRTEMKDNLSKFELMEAPCESLPFQNETFDTVLSIDVLCSVDDQKKTFDEAYRVLKTGGTAFFVEHFKTYNFWTDVFLSMVTLITYPLVGASMVRETDKEIGKSKFQITERGKVKGTNFEYFICKK
ncbi:predicted protein [Naegleria gruberi]|uniref:Predicted protein n=1 Tax=Naegleria gruberi TaxID=5762 RepID=D2VNF5_NAEGR|nr:uncharacterized protein NAEGRDRAFT_70479 [Naegleria gruberi]EFC41726.1 predicted protein [Naegleria gruberi]|eukprot:XP_002674470.1 predicted protein [Naegleria gruberi strain NEG-M]